MAFFLNPAQREGTALLEDSFCAGRCGHQRHNTGHTAGYCALPPRRRLPRPQQRPLRRRRRRRRGRGGCVGVRWGEACRAGLPLSGRRPRGLLSAGWPGASAPWCVGASARRRVGAPARRRPGAPAPRRPVPARFVLPCRNGRGASGRGNRITARQTKAAAVRGQQ